MARALVPSIAGHGFLPSPQNLPKPSLRCRSPWPDPIRPGQRNAVERRQTQPDGPHRTPVRPFLSASSQRRARPADCGTPPRASPAPSRIGPDPTTAGAWHPETPDPGVSGNRRPDKGRPVASSLRHRFGCRNARKSIPAGVGAIRRPLSLAVGLRDFGRATVRQRGGPGRRTAPTRVVTGGALSVTTRVARSALSASPVVSRAGGMAQAGSA